MSELLLLDISRVDILNRPGLNIGRVLNIIALRLVSTVTGDELSAEEDEETQKVPNVAHKRQEELRSVQTGSEVVVIVDKGHDEERSENWEHPHSGPEMNHSKAKLLSQTEPNQGDHSHKAVCRS